MSNYAMQVQILPRSPFDMKDNEIIIEVARLDGIDTSLWSDIDDSQINSTIFNAKPYLTSRDAIIPVIEKMGYHWNYHQWMDFFKLLGCKLNGEMFYGDALRLVLTATPRQLCIALLKATGRWKE